MTLVFLFLCHFSPKEGETTKTKFQTKCQNWESKDYPITYQFLYNNGKEQAITTSSAKEKDFPLFYHGLSPQKDSILPLGDENKNYSMLIICRILNEYGTYSQVNVSIKVSH